MPQSRKNSFKKDSQDYLKLLSFWETLEYTKLTRTDVARMFHYPVHQVRDYFHDKKPVPLVLLKKLHKKFIRDGFFVEKDYDPRKFKLIEPRIKPLVTALNRTGLLKTFSSCEGHFKKAEQNMDDRTRAGVRFHRLPSTPDVHMQQFMEYILQETRKADLPATFWRYKFYVPGSQPVYAIQIAPYNRLAGAALKRRHTDIGIEQVVSAVKKATMRLKKGLSLDLSN